MAAWLNRRDLTLGSPSAVVASFLGRLLTNRGDLLRRGATTAERYALGPTGAALQSDGTDAVWGKVIDAGSYFPTPTGVSNIVSVTAGRAHWLRIGAEVGVWYYTTPDVNLAAPTSSSFRLSLPITSDLQSADDLDGSGAIQGQTGAAIVNADTANNEALVTFMAQTNSAVNLLGSFGYRLI